MKCDEFEERIHYLLDQREPLQTDRRLLQHAENCSRCRSELDGYEDLFNGLDFFEPPPLTADFAARVVGQVCPVQPATKVARRWLVLAALAIAASLLIAFLPALTGRTGPQSTRVVREHTPNESSESRGKSSDDELPWGTGQLAQTPIEIPEGIDAEQIRLMWNQLTPDLPYERILPMDQIRGGLRPIANSLAMALDLLRSAIPLGSQDRSTESPDDSTGALKTMSRCISA